MNARNIILADLRDLAELEARRWPATLAELAESGVPLASKSDYLELELCDWLRGVAFATAPANVYVSLHTADPGETGASEHGATAGYVRRIIGFTGTNPLSNAAAIEYPQASAGYSAPITHFGVWDALSSGNFLGGDVLAASKTIASGDIPRFAAGVLTWTET